jgi:hypothetical protein
MLKQQQPLDKHVIFLYSDDFVADFCLDRSIDFSTPSFLTIRAVVITGGENDSCHAGSCGDSTEGGKPHRANRRPSDALKPNTREVSHLYAGSVGEKYPTPITTQ